eukprot:COSAG05_NODE_2855_length_2569_cov_10.045352_4_plen_91_part_00
MRSGLSLDLAGAPAPAISARFYGQASSRIHSRLDGIKNRIHNGACVQHKLTQRLVLFEDAEHKKKLSDCGADFEVGLVSGEPGDSEGHPP